MLYKDATSKTVEQFVEELLAESSYSDGDTPSYVPERLIADGRGIKCRYPVSLGTGIVKFYRPFPGAVFTLHEGSFSNAPELSRWVATVLKSESRFMFRLPEKGRFDLRFGNNSISLDQGDGLLYRLAGSSEASFAPPLNQFHQYAQVLLSLDGVTSIARYLDAPIPACFGVLATAISPGEMFVPFLENPELKRFSESIWQRPANSSFEAAYFRSKVCELFCILGENSKRGLRTLRNDVTVKELKKIAAVKSLIDSSTDNLSVLQLASKAGLNRRSLTEGFKNAYGVSVSQYVSEIRLARAKTLVLETDKPMTEIAFDAGYNHLSSFSRAFTHCFGASPQKLRQQKRTPQPADGGTDQL